MNLRAKLLALCDEAEANMKIISPRTLRSLIEEKSPTEEKTSESVAMKYVRQKVAEDMEPFYQAFKKHPKDI